MSIARISSSYGSIGTRKSSQDSYENNIKKQINALVEKMKTISDDEEMPAEQKNKEKQAAQEQLQNLNQELREYQIRKRQEEAEKKQEAVKEALEAATAPREEPSPEGFGGKEAGVMITLSSTQAQLAGMVRLRSSLEGRQRTASTEEEKADLQKRINNLSSGIGKKMAAAKNTISDYHKTVKKDDDKQSKTDTRKDEIFWTNTKSETSKTPAVADKPLVSDKNKLFDNVSFVIK